MPMKRGRQSSRSTHPGRSFVPTISLFSKGSAKPLGVPTAWLGGKYAGPRGRTIERSLTFFRSRKGELIERSSGREELLLLGPIEQPSALSLPLPKRVVSPDAVATFLGWDPPKARGASTLHALTTAFTPFLADLGIASCKATWLSAQVQPRVTRIALHAAETGELLLLASFPTPAALIAAGITGVGFWWKLLALAALVALLVLALAMIFGSGPITAAVWAAASALLKAAVVLAVLEILFVVLDMLLEAYTALFPGMAAQIAALRAARRKVQAAKDKIKAKKEAGEDVTDDDLSELKDAIKDIKDTADALDREIDAELPNATGEKKDELNEGKKATKKIREALAEIEKFLDGLKKP